MTKTEALKQLNIGYILFISGALLGVLIHKNIELNGFASAFVFGYFFGLRIGVIK